jgi:hypothetical protein
MNVFSTAVWGLVGTTGGAAVAGAADGPSRQDVAIGPAVAQARRAPRASLRHIARIASS